MEKVFFIIGIISAIVIVLHLLFLTGLNIYETIKNKVNKTNDYYTLDRCSNVWLYRKDEFYLIPTISINKVYYLEITAYWLCFTISIGYKIKNDNES